MGQKIHPLGLRLGITQNHRSTWFAKTHNYPRLLLEDRLLRQYLFQTYPKAKIVDILIRRPPKLQIWKTDKIIERVEITLYTPAIFLIVDAEDAKASIKALKTKLQKLCQTQRDKAGLPHLRLRLRILPIKEPFGEASGIGDYIVEELENRVAFRAVLKKALEKVESARKLKGVRIQIAGRLNGAEIARTEWSRQGRVPLQTLRADVGYASKSAKTVYGILGIKVWAFKDEKI